MIEHVEAFRQAIERHGLQPGDIEPGRFHRFPGADKGTDNRAGWARMFDNGQGGAFGDWSTGISEAWQAEPGKPLTPEEQAAFRRMTAEAKLKAEQTRKAEQAAAAKRAEGIWKAAPPAPADHPYLKAKNVQAHGLRLYDDALAIPLRDEAGAFCSLQFIGPDCKKRFLKDGKKQGCYFAIGGKPEKVLCIAEGYATAATIHEATGYPVAVAFDAGNLKPVSLAIRAKLPDTRLIICADDDETGITKATEAALAVGGLVAVPDFGQDRQKDMTDFNDLARHRGPESVKKIIEAARPVEQIEAAPVGDNTPEPLPDELLPVAEFDFALLPESLRPWAEDICERVQCPPDFVAAGIMASLAAVIGRKVGIRPQSRTDWTVVPNIWALVVGRPGVLKSPALDAALAPLNRLVAKANEDHTGADAEYRKEQAVAKLRAEAGEKAARKKLAENPDADVSALLAVDEPDTPTLKRYKANDTSPASLGELLRQNANGLLVYRDELVSLLKGLDREDQAEGRGFYLTAWNGDSPYTFDRIGRGLNLNIEAICLSILGGTQPGRLAEYIRHAVKGGAADDGLIQRFGLLVWPDTGGTWKDVDRWPDTDAKNQAFKVFDYLDKIDPATIGAAQDTDLDGNPDGLPYLRLDAGGLELFQEWRFELETRLRGGDLPPALESHFAKYRKLIPALALIIHLADEGSGPVTEKATLQALAWGDYLETHARRAYGVTSRPGVTTAKAILHRIKKGDLPASFSSRDIWRNGWAMLSDSEQVAEALRLLVDYGHLREERNDETRGRPSTTFHVIEGGKQ